jgi:hypothetical protein
MLWLKAIRACCRRKIMKKLPVGIQTFRQIIEEGYVYADRYAGSRREVYKVAASVCGAGHTRIKAVRHIPQ